jgi:adenylate cyclase
VRRLFSSLLVALRRLVVGGGGISREAGVLRIAHVVARGLLEQTGNDGPEPWIPVGAGVHTGKSFVGTVGEGDARDFTALGDTVNTAARLTGLAGAGEILISTEAATAGALETTGLERRTLELRGKDQTVDAWVVTARREP